jgi:branched-chain amino acid transport system ATP-binding protein
MWYRRRLVATTLIDPVGSPLVPRTVEELFAAEPARDDELTALEVRELSVRFGGVAALSGVTFEVEPNSVLAVIGPNGAGKSTLLNAISGLVRQNASGQIVLKGRPVLGRSPVAIARAGVSRSFQDPPLISTETVIENVLVGAHLRLGYGMGDQIWRRRKVRRIELAAEERAAAVLALVGLSDVRHQRVNGLAYGTRKLVDIARAIVAAPSVLLLDEPTSGLDGPERAAVSHLISELRRRTSLAIVVVEHHMDVVRTVADKVVVLDSGTVLGVGAPTAVLGMSDVRSALGGTGHQRAARQDAAVAHVNDAPDESAE